MVGIKDLGQVGVYLIKGLVNGMPDSLAYPIAWGTPESGTPATISLVAALINQKENLIEGIRYALDSVEGSLSLILMNQAGLYAARDKYGRTPVVIGRKEDAFCISLENFAYHNLGYADYRELGPGEIALVTDKSCVTLSEPGDEMKICTFLWVYYGYPASSYEGMNVEQMRYHCGRKMAERDDVKHSTVSRSWVPLTIESSINIMLLS